MKNIKLVFLLLITTFSHAQTPILDLHTNDFGEIENAYYKDIENFYNQFEGTWIYSDSEITIRFKFIKKEMFNYQSNVNCYHDVLVGEIQFLENNVEKINSLNNLRINFNSIFEYSLFSYGKTKLNITYPCIGCLSQYGILMRYNESSNNDICLEALFTMRRLTIGGVEKLNVQYSLSNSACGLQSDWETPSTNNQFIIPYGNYVLTKEN